MGNWVQSLEGVAGLNVKQHYPKCYANWEIVKSKPPEESLPFIYGFPVFCGYVTDANKDARANGFDINKYWDEGRVTMTPEAKAAMAKHGWNNGYVAFAFTASETSVKVATALPQVQDTVKWVTVNFDDTPLMD